MKMLDAFRVGPVAMGAEYEGAAIASAASSRIAHKTRRLHALVLGARKAEEGGLFPLEVHCRT